MYIGELFQSAIDSREMSYETHNVKFHFKVDKKECLEYCLRKKLKNRNFDIHRIGKKVFTVFTSGHVNVTGVKSFDRVNESVLAFTSEFGLSFQNCCETIVIDNSTSSACVLLCNNERIDLSSLKGKVENSTLSLRPHFFPGAVLRRKNKCTIIVFTTGRFIIIGAKSQEAVCEAYRTICAIIETL